MYRTTLVCLLVLSALAAHPVGTATQGGGPAEAFHRPFDQILDLNVRDGFVYYRALKGARGRLDRYVASLNVPAATVAGWTREHQMAFWVNAYNAIALQAVVDRYPIRGGSGAYPANSIRQVSGVFDRAKHRVAGRSLTLDEIEKTILPQFKEPRVYLALGRGAVGSGRLRSEAYTGERVMQQLDEIQAEFVNEQSMMTIDRPGGQMAVTSIISWHEAEFAAAYDKGASGPLSARSPIERAVLAFVAPRLLPLEREFVQKNEFTMAFLPFDWRLNDLTGGRPQ
jgi:hypothetical protein